MSAFSNFCGLCSVLQLLSETGAFNANLLQNVDSNLHSPQRRLIELRIEHADLDASIDRLSQDAPMDELMLRRLKKRRLALRDQIARLESAIDGKEPA
jgi:hypothetical protein